MARRHLPLISQLWINYPHNLKPCDGPYENQCAIRMSIALEKSGFALTNYVEPVCKHGHARGAEALAHYLKKHVGPPLVSRGQAGFPQSTTMKQGIMFFKDIEGFRGGRGDHIDIYLGGNTRTGNYWDESKEVWLWSWF